MPLITLNFQLLSPPAFTDSFSPNETKRLPTLQVTFGGGIQPDHPSSEILSDPHCVAAWLQSSLSAARYDLSTALAQGLPSIATSQIAPRHVAKLQTLLMVAEALASKSFSSSGPTGSSSRTARRILATSHSQTPASTMNNNRNMNAVPESPSTLVIESNRLLQTAKIMHWLSTQQILQTNPSGRFSSFATWQGTVSRRKTGAGSSPLLLTELIDSVVQYEVDVISYPPSSLESLITTLFLSGNATSDAFQAKVAVLSYSLVDANFLKAPDVVKGVHRHFAIPRTTACGWMLLLFLDDAQLVSLDAPNNSSLNQAVNWLPGVNALTIPFRALRVFVDRGRGDVALGLLCQRIGSQGQKEINEWDISAACTALRVRLVNGLLVESFIEMKRYLQSVPEEKGKREQHTQRLIEELLLWGKTTEGALTGIISLPISLVNEEPALLSWLQRSIDSMPSAGIILTLYYLMRGRTPEALLTYAKYGTHVAEMTGTSAVLDSSSSMKKVCGQVEELLRAACRIMPAAQRALVVGTAAEPALRFSEEDQEKMIIDGGVHSGGIALVSALPGLDTGGLPTLISVGPTDAEAPLVGGVMTGIARSMNSTQGSKEKEGLPVVKEPSAGGKAVLPLLFGQAPAAASDVLHTSTPSGSRQFGAGLNRQTLGAGGTTSVGLHTGRQQHQLDALLGITPETQAIRIKSRRTLR